MSRTLIAAFIGGITGVIFTTYAAYAWTGPTQAAPDGNVSAPINIGTGSQVKNGNLSVNAFTGTQDSIFYGKLGVGSSVAPAYTLTVTSGNIGGAFGITPKYASWAAYGTGDGGAALYNDSGTYKKLMIVGNSSAGGSREVGIWDNLTVNGQIYSTSGGIKFPDGTVQTTAPTGGGISAVTTATCNGGGGGCTATCPAGYFRTGCSGMITYPNGSAWPTGAQPSGTNACFCRNAGATAPCYAYCAK